jgi:hypothetical protein
VEGRQLLLKVVTTEEGGQCTVMSLQDLVDLCTCGVSLPEGSLQMLMKVQAPHANIIYTK